MAYGIELRGELSLHRNRLGQSSPSASTRGQATPRLIWWNFAHLFMVSLVPFSTAWIARARMASTPVLSMPQSLCSSISLILHSNTRCSPRPRHEPSPPARAIAFHLSHVPACHADIPAVSIVGIWIGLLRSVCLSSSGDSRSNSEIGISLSCPSTTRKVSTLGQYSGKLSLR